MSSMRNAVTRRPHKERSQPVSRAKWGILEKHKDYSLRAADYNLKKAKLKQLERKVREKHPDEFAYGMIKGQGQGKHGGGGTENRLGHDAVKLLKTQDQGYLRVAMARNRREMGRVREELGAALDEGGEGRGRKVVFEEVEGLAVGEARGKKRRRGGGVLEDVAVNELTSAAVLEEAGTHDEVEDEENVTPTTKPQSKKQLLAAQDRMTRLRAERKKRRKLQEVRSTKLEMLKRRQKQIMAAADELELQRTKMAKTVGGVNKDGVKFKIRERKK